MPLREAAGLSQAALSREAGLSPSYLNQIERDQRPLPRALLQRFCGVFSVGIDFFGESADMRRMQDMREALADPLFGSTLVDLSEIQHAVQVTPDLSDRFLRLYQAYCAQSEDLAAARGFSEAATSHALAPYEEVRDWVQSRLNHFQGLDRAAEALFETEGFTSATLRDDLNGRLQTMHGFSIAADPALLAEGTFWRIDRRSKRLFLAGSASQESRIFWMAHLLGQIEQKRLIDKEVHAARLSTAEARALARIALANYFAGALILPYRRFLEAAQTMRYDIERLQGLFGASYEQICHRLSTMQRPGLAGIPFYFVKTDVAGNVLKRSSATRFQFSRFGGPCPLWNVYRTFATPGQVLVQLARTPDNATYLNIARTVSRAGGSHLARPRSVAVVLGCEIEHAAQTVYAAGLDFTDADVVVPIGPGCRTCERTGCRHRAMPPVGQVLDVGTEERGVVPYRIKTG